MKCLVISDPATTMCAASMNVGTGSTKDPDDCLGLAHFTEHMLFMGTEKYPEENHYSKVLQENSGGSNAFTAFDNTNYYFTVSNEKFRDMLDIFAQFYICPTFNESSTEREMQAVHSEYEMNIQSDMWRQFQLLRSFTKPNPYSRFNIGNMDTLKHEGIRDELMKYHKDNYSSDIMSLCVYGSSPVETLEQWVREDFSAIQNFDKDQAPLPSPYADMSEGMLFKMVPVQSTKSLNLYWTLPALFDQYPSRSADYLAHLIGHEGENSLLSLLKKKNLATELSAGTASAYMFKSFGLFACSVDLTQEGLENYETVLELIYAYVNMLKDRGIQDWIYEECRDLANYQYKFKNKAQPVQTAQRLAERLTNYPAEKVLTAYELYERFEPDTIREILDCFCPEKSIVIMLSQSFEEECKETDPWFGTKYCKQTISDADLLAKLKAASYPELDLPPRNPYITKDFTVLPASSEKYPSKILNDDFQDVWYFQDNKFGDVKAYADIALYTNDLNYGISTTSQILANTWVDIFIDRNREKTYLAQQGGYAFGFSATPHGIMLSTSGYAEHIVAFTKDMISTMASFQISESDRTYFDELREKYLNNQKSFFFSAPYRQLKVDQWNLLHDKGFHSIAALNEATKAMTFDDLLYFSNRFLRKIRSESLIIGNLNEDSAREISTHVAEAFSDRKQLPRHQLIQLRMHQVPSNPNADSAIAYTRQLDDPENTNSAILAMWQYEEFDISKSAIFCVLDSMMSEPIFDVLRTKEQLGYVVLKQKWVRRGIIGIEIIIQSAKASPVYLGHRITTFLKTFKDDLAQMTEENFNTHVQSVITRLSKPSISLFELAKKFHSEIDCARYEFDRQERLIENLKNVTFQQVKDCYEDIFYTQNRRLDVELVGASHAESYKEELTQLDRKIYENSQSFKAETMIHRQVFKRY